MPRGDGRLTHDLDPQQPGPQDECGVFGVWAPGEEVAKLTYFGLYALQHRGQEAAGIAVSDGSGVVVYKDLGLVAQVFDEATLSSLRGHIAIGHARYSHHRRLTWENAQPTLARRRRRRECRHHDRARAQRQPGQHRRAGQAGSPSCGVDDGEHVRHRAGGRAARGAPRPVGRGGGAGRAADSCAARSASSSWTRTRCTRPATRTACARSCSAASSAAGWSRARPPRSTSSARAVVREIEPGELIAIDEHGLRSQRFAAPDPKGCLFEYVYLARPDTTISGRNVYAARVEVGRTLAREHPVEADLVIPVPESGTPAAIGYAEESGIPYGAGLVKNAYVGRTFIQPSQTIRQLGIRLKLNPLRARAARQARRGRRRLDRARQHAARDRPHAARGRRDRGARPHLVAAGEVAVLLRHRLRHPGRAARQRSRHSRASAARSAPTRSATCRSTA